jgi:dopamine beta-monooxygenase
MPSDAQEIMFTIENVILPTTDTYYYNSIFKLPEMPDKLHVLKWEVKLPDLNFINMHHFLFYECSNYNGTPSILPGDSVTNATFDTFCGVAPIITWAVGGKLSRTYPADTGYPLGGPNSPKYARMELHFNNPALKFGKINIKFIKKRETILPCLNGFYY